MNDKYPNPYYGNKELIKAQIRTVKASIDKEMDQLGQYIDVDGFVTVHQQIGNLIMSLMALQNSIMRASIEVALEKGKMIQ